MPDGSGVQDLHYRDPLRRAEFWEATAVTELRGLAHSRARRACTLQV